MDVLEKLIAEAKRRGMNEGDLAILAGLRPARLSKWKSGTVGKGPSFGEVVKMAGVVGVSLDFLADETANEPPSESRISDEAYILQLYRDLKIPRDEAARRLAASGPMRADAAPPTAASGEAHDNRPKRRARGAG